MSKPVVRYAELYDGVGLNGTPFFRRARFTVNDPAERQRLSKCLSEGSDIVAGMKQEADVMKVSGEPQMISITYVTDGDFVWRRELAYYVERYGIAPDDAFYEHIRNHDYQLALPEVTDELTDAFYDLMESRP